jgi:hypothetical protein
VFGRWQLDPLDRWQGWEETSGGTLKEAKFIFAWVDEFKLLRLRIDRETISIAVRFRVIFRYYYYYCKVEGLFTNDALPFISLGSLKILPSSGFRVEGYSLLLSVLEIDLGCDGSILKFHVRLIWNIEFLDCAREFFWWLAFKSFIICFEIFLFIFYSFRDLNIEMDSEEWKWMKWMLLLIIDLFWIIYAQVLRR